MDASLIPNLEIDYADVSARSIPGEDLGSVPRQVGAEESDDHSAYEQPSLLFESFVKSNDEGLEYESGSFVAEHLEQRATNDFHESGLNMESVQEEQEQSANAELVGSLNVQLDHELIPESGLPQSKEEMNAKKIVDEKFDDLSVYELPPLPIESLVKGDDVRMEFESGPSVPEHLEHRPTDDFHKIDSSLQSVQEVQQQASKDNVLGSPDNLEVDQELVSDSEVPLNNEEMSAQEVGDEEHDEQPSFQIESLVKDDDEMLEFEPDFSVPEHLEHRETNDLHEVSSNTEGVLEIQEEASKSEVVGSQVELEVDHELVPDSTNLCSNQYMNVREVGDEEYDDLSVCKQPSLPVESLVKGDEERVEFESGSSVPGHLEHRTTNDLHDHEVGSKTEEGAQEMQEQASNAVVVASLNKEVDQELVSDFAKPRSREEKNTKRASLKPGSSIKEYRVKYQLPSEDEGEFAVFDLVWGKVKSHPWWPGQIFHPSDSSEKAMKYYKKDCYLVAYFGDRTFAWNEASVLKPFRNHFPQAERQNSSEAFQNAVRCSLEEVTRRVELGLACSCVPEEVYDKIKYQIVENSGIREESSKREGVDRSTGPDSFQPAKLTEYVKTLALFPTSGFDRLDLAVAKAQLFAFNQLRGCDALPEFQYYEGLVEYDADILPGNQELSDDNEPVTGVNGKKGPRKRKHNLKDIVYQRRKEKSMTDLMGETMYYLDGEFDSPEEDDIFLTSPSAGPKRKASAFLTDDFTAPQSTKTISLAKVSHKPSPNSQQSFKVGECIRRLASQMTGSSTIIKDCSEESNKRSGDNADEVSEPLHDTMTESTPMPSEQSSLEEMLSQLYLSAQNPMKGYSFFRGIISFFTEFRNSAVTTQRQKMRKGNRKKKASVPVKGSPENFEFDERNDSYWTDMVVQDNPEAKSAPQDNPEAKSARRGRKRKDERVGSGDSEKPTQRKPRKNSRKQYHVDNPEAVPEMPTVDEKKLDLPTELLLNFGEMGSLPSEVNLNKMFKRFGPLKESETKVDVEKRLARVVFKKRSDAEVAYSSAAMFNIFGSTIVNYQLNYTPVLSIKNSPAVLTNGIQDAT